MRVSEVIILCSYFVEDEIHSQYSNPFMQAALKFLLDF
jgi:hypothetical protein